GVGAKINTLAFSPDGKLLAASGGNKTIIWDLQEEAEPKTFTGVSAAFSPDTKYLATVPVYLGKIQNWDIKTAKELGTFTLGNLEMRDPGSCGIAISSKGKFLALPAE